MLHYSTCKSQRLQTCCESCRCELFEDASCNIAEVCCNFAFIYWQKRNEMIWWSCIKQKGRQNTWTTWLHTPLYTVSTAWRNDSEQRMSVHLNDSFRLHLREAFECINTVADSSERFLQNSVKNRMLNRSSIRGLSSSSTWKRELVSRCSEHPNSSI